MSDLRTLLHEAAPSDDAVSDTVVEADLGRARRALRRRRASRLSAGSGIIAAAAVGALVLVGPGGSTTSPSGGGTSAAPNLATPAVELVAYSGTQPVGYVLDKVPAGWNIRDNSAGLLTLAPDGAAPPETESGTTSLVGTIAISTQSDTGVPTGVQLDDVTVDGAPAVIAHMTGAGDTRTLFAQQASGTYLVIQVWDGLGWGNRQIAEFASSVHITSDAQPSVG